MTNTLVCKNCLAPFVISDQDLAFYEKIHVPLPQLCPRDRLRRRLSFRNERNLYKRKCDKTGKDVISNIRPDAAVVVYEVEEWHKDNWNAPFLPSFDFSKGFFEQFKTLMRVAPHMHKASGGNEFNSLYINHAGNCKNCYFIFNSEYDEDCMYLRFADHCRDCLDCTNILDSELCYECVNVERGYRLFFSDDCKGSRDSAFLRYCHGVQNSIFCYGLEQKEYHIFNKPVGKEAFLKKLQELKLNTYSGLQKAKQIFLEWSKQFPQTRQILLNCVNCTGDCLYNSKQAFDCYNGQQLEDCRYVLNSVKVKDSYDLYAYGEAELCYEFVTAFKVYNCKFCSYCVQSSGLEYCDYCWGCHSCFGCIGLKGKSYCIFNKQYTKEEYEDLVPRIIEHMGGPAASAQREREGTARLGLVGSQPSKAEPKNKEYGEFFSIEMSYFPYEDSMAQDYFQQQEKITAPMQESYEETSILPDDINQIDPEIFAQKTFLCPETKKLFRFQNKELEFYKKMQLPVPRVSFEARYKKRNRLIPFPY